MASLVKLILIYCLRIFVRLMYLAPIKKNRIIFNSYRGGQYSCNPKYISKYLMEHYPGKFEIIWAFNEPNKYKYLKKQGIKIVRYASLKRFFFEATAKVSINNIGSFSWLPLRHGQLHINTWHGGGCYKKVSMGEVKNDNIMKKTLLMTSKETSLFLSSSKYFSNKVVRVEFDYSGDILESGMPRNDILINQPNQNFINIIKKRIDPKLLEEVFIVLYAPTWRYDSNKKFEVIDVIRVKEAIEKRFGKKSLILYRAHHISGGKIDSYAIDVTSYYDMQELLLISDILITDYSSSMWDFSLTTKPCFLFTPDLKEYIAERGFVKDIHTWGFPICETNTQLVREIQSFDEKLYKEKIENHHRELGSFEKGDASKLVTDVINEICL